MSPPVFNALEALKKVSLTGKTDKALVDTVDSVTTELKSLLLNDVQWPADSKIFDKLGSTFRGPLVRLYDAFPSYAVHLSSAIFSFIFYEKVKKTSNHALQARWEKTADLLLSGVLDFMEKQDNAIAFEAVASAMYPTLCNLCFSDDFSSIITTGTIGLRVTAFTLISDSVIHPANRIKLRRSEILGSQRIGNTLYNSKEYLVLENLFTLISRLISPPPMGRNQRSSFIREVFGAPASNGLDCADELIDVFSTADKIDSEELFSRCFDVLASSSILFPQPFKVYQVDACETVFPQESLDRLFVDERSFFVAVSEDHQYETFRIPFTIVDEITLSPNSSTSRTKVFIRTTLAPEFGGRNMEIPSGQQLITSFYLPSDNVESFKNTLKARGLNQIFMSDSSHKPPPRLSIGDPTRLEFGVDGDLFPELPSFQDKVTNIGLAMELDNPNDELSDAPEPLITRSFQTPSPPSWQKTQTITPARLLLKGPPVVSHFPPFCELNLKTNLGLPEKKTLMAAKTPSRKSPVAPQTPSPVKIIDKSVFGYSGDEPSELSDDADSLKVLSQRQKRNTALQSKTIRRGSAVMDVKGNRVLDSDDQKALNARRKTFSSVVKKNLAAASDSWSEIESPGPKQKLIEQQGKGTDLAGIRGQFSSGRVESVSPISSPLDELRDGAEYVKSPRKSIPRKPLKSVTKLVDAVQVMPEPDLLASTKKRKRNQEDSSQLKALDPAENAPRAKRVRARNLKENLFDAKNLPDSQILKKGRKTAANTYGNRTKKRRTPSLVPSGADMHIDYKDVPTVPKHQLLSSPVKILSKTADQNKSVSGIATRTRAAAMKNKKNELIPAKSTGFVATQKTNVQGAPVTSFNQTEAEKGRLPSEFITETDVDINSKSLPQSSTTSDPSVKKTAKHRKGNFKDKQNHKQKKAPWESTDFLRTIERDPISKTFAEAPEDMFAEDSIIPEHIQDDSLHTGILVPDVSLAVDAACGQEIRAEKDSSVALQEKSVEFGSRLSALSTVPKHSLVEVKKIVTVPVDAKTQVVAPVTEWASIDSPKNRKIDDPPTTAERPKPGASLQEVIKISEKMTVGPEKTKVIKKLHVSTCVSPDVTMIDLTQAESPIRKIFEGRRESSPAPAIDHRSHQESKKSIAPIPRHINPDVDASRQALNRLIVGKPSLRPDGPIHDSQSNTPARMHAKVMFAPETKGNTSVNQFMGGAKKFLSHPRSKATIGGYRPVSGKHHHRIDEEQEEEIREKVLYDSKGRNIQGIVDVLNEINEVIIGKITGRFDAVEEEAKMYRSKLLDDAVGDLRIMQAMSASTFNSLVDLQEAYANKGRRLVGAFEDNVAVNREISQFVRQRMEEHDRHSVVGKMPRTLTSRPFSELIQKYRSD